MAHLHAIPAFDMLDAELGDDAASSATLAGDLALGIQQRAAVVPIKPWLPSRLSPCREKACLLESKELMVASYRRFGAYLSLGDYRRRVRTLRAPADAI